MSLQNRECRSAVQYLADWKRWWRLRVACLIEILTLGRV